MQCVTLSSFRDFLDKHLEHLPSIGCSNSDEPVLYRGQSSTDFPLSTTLERFGAENFRASDYAGRLGWCSSEFASLLGDRYDFRSAIRDLNRWQDIKSNRQFLEFAVRLRHHGFPSPLLDWTASPYIAAFFAYSNAEVDASVAIYTFVEMPDGMKAWSSDDVLIETVGPYIASHERHHIQQCRYTVCTKFVDGGDVFARHDEVNYQDRQDVLVKFELPGRERDAVLRLLNAMNVNAYTLFRDEAGLCRLLAEKHLR